MYLGIHEFIDSRERDNGFPRFPLHCIALQRQFVIDSWFGLGVPALALWLVEQRELQRITAAGI